MIDKVKTDNLIIERMSASFAIMAGILAMSAYAHEWNIGPEQWPNFLAPGITIFVASMTLTQYIIKKAFLNNVLGNNLFYWLTCLCLGATYIICFFLTFQHGWLKHLCYMASLFIVFWLWDICTLGLTSKISNEYFIEQRKHIKSGNILINSPSLVMITILLYILFKNWILPNDWTIEAPVNTFRQPPKDLSPKDVFVSGVISFHLFVAALGYFFGAATKMKEGKAAAQDTSA